MPGIVRPPAVSGRFYPSNPATLSKEIDGFIESAIAIDPGVSPTATAIMAPHAGYIYSGAVAARAWARIRHLGPSTVVLIGPDHFFGYPHVAVYARGAFGTPLGNVEIDEDLALALVGAGGPILERPEVHQREHSLEVHVPFVKRLFPAARIVPILMGLRSAANIDALVTALAQNLPGRNVLLVASSDLSHYHDQETAARLDAGVMSRVEEMDADGLRKDLAGGICEACGGDPLVVVLESSLRLGVTRAKVLTYADSGTVNGDTGSVVGYMSAVIEKEDGADSLPDGRAGGAESRPGRSSMSDGVEVEVRAGDMSAGGAEDEPIADRESRLSLSIAEISHLLSLARDSVAHAARGAEFVCPDDLWPENLKACCGAFVTIRCGEELRGCVGFNRPLFPLAETVIRAARGAVLDDCRFSPVEAHEIGSLTIEISVLTESRPASIDEIVIGRHGIIVSRGPRRGLLLPQVAVEHGWTPQRFLSETCRKAGLAPDAWNHGATVEIFEAFVCSGPA